VISDREPVARRTVLGRDAARNFSFDEPDCVGRRPSLPPECGYLVIKQRCIACSVAERGRHASLAAN
jgi:hypothetical protein